VPLPLSQGAALADAVDAEQHCRSGGPLAAKEIDDDAAVLLSHEIAREIEEHLEYPGQIKVTVIRESRAIEYAK